MIVPHQLVHAANQNGERAQQYLPPLGRKIGTDDVVDLIVSNTNPAAQRGGRELLSLMSLGRWRVVAAVHPSESDRPPHITVRVSGDDYHLRLDAPQCIFDITRRDGGKTHRPAGVPPWVGPGAG